MPLAVFLLAAGLGTRLRPLTTYIPKPLLPVGDRPALAHILDRVRPLGGPLVANAHHLAPDLPAFLAASAPDVRVSEEPTLLGTAGGLRQAARLLGPGDILVWNGDILASLDAEALVAAHEASDAAATLAVRMLNAGEGNVGIDASGKVVRLRRETTTPGEARGGAFLGIHVVGAQLRGGLPAEGCLVGDVYLPVLRAGGTLRAFDVGEVAWDDIGTLEDYAQANASWLRLHAPEGESFVGEGARVAPGVTLRRSIVGAGACVEGAGSLERCVVWPVRPSARRAWTPWSWAPAWFRP